MKAHFNSKKDAFLRSFPTESVDSDNDKREHYPFMAPT
jgi:hypothetical protein